jgi:hypothetical protein
MIEIFYRGGFGEMMESIERLKLSKNKVDRGNQPVINFL